MKKYLSGILVVEGKEDASYLSNYIDSEIVITNGFELDEKTVKYLKDKIVIALFDPDEAGEEIRSKFKKLLPQTIDVFVDIKRCSRGKKCGVAECEIIEILDKLSQYCIEKPTKTKDIKQSDLYNLGLIENKQKREMVCDKLNLGKCNGKLLYKRLIINNITIEKLQKTIEEINHGN